MRTFAFPVLVVFVAFGLVACCCGSVAEEDPAFGSPLTADTGEEAAPVVTPAGWESPFANGSEAAKPPVAPDPMSAGSANSDWESYRSANARLRQQVERLSSEVDSLMSERSAPPPPAVANRNPVVAPPAADARPAISVEGVRSVLSGAGASNIRVALNARNEVYLTIPGTTFASGKADLKPAARAELQRAVSALRTEFPGMRLRVEGHTDSQPIRKSKWGSNEKLSQARADSVREHLVSSTGVRSEEIESVGYGSSRPVASNKTAADMALNRRCELVLVP